MLRRGEGIVWKAIRESSIVYIPDVENFPEEIACDFTSRSHVDIPLYHQGKIIGLLNAQYYKVDAFTIEDIQTLSALASHIPIAIINSRMFETIENQKKHFLNELSEAREVQNNLFPKKNPEVEGFKFSAICEPSFKVGGDWYDYIYFPVGRIGVVIADVSGKGLSAALLMSSTKMMFKHVAMSIASPAEVLKKVIRILMPDIPNTKFITLLYAVLDPKNNEIVFSNAGHLNPIKINSNEVRVINLEPGHPLSIFESNYSEQKLSFEKGEKLFFYSDGITDSIYNIGESFEIERVLKYFGQPETDIQSLSGEIKKFSLNSPQVDDITMLMIESLAD